MREADALYFVRVELRHVDEKGDGPSWRGCEIDTLYLNFLFLTLTTILFKSNPKRLQTRT